MEITNTGHWFTDQKEEVYFLAEGTLPRVGVVKARFHAFRYVARFYDDNNVGRDGWTQWRITCDSNNIEGVGPKTKATLYSEVEPQIEAWLASPEYQPSRAKEIARFIARTATNSFYGLEDARKFLGAYKNELSPSQRNNLEGALAHLSEARKLLNGVNQ